MEEAGAVFRKSLASLISSTAAASQQTDNILAIANAAAMFQVENTMWVWRSQPHHTSKHNCHLPYGVPLPYFLAKEQDSRAVLAILRGYFEQIYVQ